MNQRGRKSRNYRPDSTGSNVLFTLGLFSVVALLVVGYIMTRGDFSASTLSELGKDIIRINPTPTASAPAPTATPAGVSLTTTGGAATVPDANLQAQMDALRASYEQTLKQEREQAQKQQDEIRLQYESKISELKKENLLLKMENQNLRGEK